MNRTLEMADVAFVLVPRFNMLSLTTLLEPMRVANYLSPQPLYRWQYISVDGGDVQASNGMCQATTKLSDADEAPSLVFICGSWGAEHYHNTKLLNWLRRLYRKGSRLVAIELGIYLLAHSGLLGEQVATTHWSWMPGFAEQFPQVQVREQLFTGDGRILTCAGGTATLDLGLHLIAESHGDQLAFEVAEQIMHHPVRSGDSPQRHTLGVATDKIPADLRTAIILIEKHVDEPLTVPDIAARTGISQRQLERLFKRYIGCSVVQFSQLLRLQYARVLLTSTRLPIRDVSVAAGFNSMSYFSQAFARCFGKKPSEYRQAWPDQDPVPSWPGAVSSFIETVRFPEARTGQLPGIFTQKLASLR